MNARGLLPTASDDDEAALIKEYKELFNLVDTSQNGKIDRSELEHLLELTTVNIHDNDVLNMIEEADSTGLGETTFDDFMSLMTCKVTLNHSIADIERAFCHFATESQQSNKDSLFDPQRFIDRRSLLRILTSPTGDHTMSLPAAEKILKKIGNNESLVDYRALCNTL